jgi:carbon storage regulator
MLYLSRREGEAVVINNAIEVRVVAVRGKTVRLGLRFPPEVSVLREEVFLQVREGNEAATRAAARLLGEEGTV